MRKPTLVAATAAALLALAAVAVFNTADAQPPAEKPPGKAENPGSGEKSPTQGNVPTPMAKAAHDIRITANGHQYNVQLYGAGNTLAAWPVLAFKADPKTGHALVDFEEPVKAGDPAKVSIHLVINPTPILKAAESQLTADSKGTASKITSVIMKSLSVEQVVEKGGPESKFKPYNFGGETNAMEIVLNAYLPVAEAKAYSEQLRLGKAQVDFRVTCDLYANREIGAAAAKARIVKATDTKAYTDLLGTGGASSTVAKGNTVSQTAAPVNRAQRQQLEADLAEEIAVQLQIRGNPRKFEIVKQLVTEFVKSQAFGTERPIDFSIEALKTLNQYGFDPNDIKPNVVEKFATAVKDFLNNEMQNEMTFAAAASGFGFKANVSYSKKDVVKQLSDKGWNISEEGKKFVPKSISVSDVNVQNIRAHVGFSVTLTEEDYGTVFFDQQVTTRARIAVDMNADELSRLRSIEQRVEVLTAETSRLATALTVTSAALLELIVRGGVDRLEFVTYNTTLIRAGLPVPKETGVLHVVQGDGENKYDLSHMIPKDKEVVAAFRLEWGTNNGADKYSIISVGAENANKITLTVHKGDKSGDVHGFATAILLRPKTVPRSQPMK